MKNAPYYIPAYDWDAVDDLPTAWRWHGAWSFAKRLGLANPSEQERRNEPVEVDVEFLADQVTDVETEVRVVGVGVDGEVEEVPSQAHVSSHDEGIVTARLFFLADLPAAGDSTFLIFYGNPKTPKSQYTTDLTIDGQGWDLTVETDCYRVDLAPSMGQLKSVYFKTSPPVSHEPPPAFVGAGPPMDGGHGVEGSVHWGPDWSDEHTGRYRITNWEQPPECDILRGPVALRITRRGHPILAVGPGVGRWQHVMASVTYTFFARTPWFLMESRLDVLADVRFRDCRNDEWVGLIPALPESAWMTRDGTIGFGPKSWRGEDPAWMTYFNRTTKDGFASIHLDYECTHPNGREPDVVSLHASSMRLRNRGGWVRYPIRHATMREGDFVSERNAYLLYRLGSGKNHGLGMLTDYHHRLTHPIEQQRRVPAPKPLTVDNVTEALRDCYDRELYIQGDLFGQRLLSVIDLGLVRQVRIVGADVHIELVMPYPGRNTWFDWYASSMESCIRERIADVGIIDVSQVHEPAWRQQDMNARARHLLGL
jgi:metal-sulfur cluster biosynthetic enzyme